MYAFIFSKKPGIRLFRHISFWLAYYFYTVFTYLPDLKIGTFTDPQLYNIAFLHAIRFLPAFVISVYFFLYFILPKYQLNKKREALIFAVVFLIFFSIPAFYYTTKWIFEQDKGPWDNLDILDETFTKCIQEQLIITGSAIIIKTMKDYSLSQRNNELLAIEKTRNKLRLIKMQIHPQILFAYLNNIYNDLDAGNIHAPQMILKLAELINYRAAS